MRIGLVSDTHGNRAALQKVVKLAGPVDQWLHAGDHVRDADYLREFSGVPVHTVAGNCDASDVAPPEQFLTLGGCFIMLTHGHRYKVKDSLNELVWWARHYETNIVVFGHTHKAVVIREEGLLIINPGSPAFPRGDSATSFGLLEISPEETKASIVEIE
jgi:putative phosphoesterase